jgi:hypothetical protein
LLIWGIDALQKWQVDLESSIDHIQEATKDLMAQIMDVSSCYVAAKTSTLLLVGQN